MNKLFELLILTLSIFVFGGLTSKIETPKSDFEFKVENFLKKYSSDFSESPERLLKNYNDLVLDSKVKNVWSKSVTLKSKTSFVNSNKQIVFQRLYLGFYQFSSSSSSKAYSATSVVDTLLNCFGSECQKIKRGINGQSVKTSPVFYLLNENEIIVCHIACEHSNDFWATFKHDLKMTFGNDASTIIDVGCGGPINFNKF